MMSMKAFSTLRNWWRRIWPTKPRIIIDTILWQEMIGELGRRGLDGRREAGCFLLASALGNQRVVTTVAYFDDLDPSCLVGCIHFRQSGYRMLADLCSKEFLRVVADVHTHPSTSVSQSDIDQTHPMISRTGHIAIIVPHYGMRFVTARAVGVHEYRAQCGWRSWFGREAVRILRIKKVKNGNHKPR